MNARELAHRLLDLPVAQQELPVYYMNEVWQFALDNVPIIRLS